MRVRSRGGMTVLPLMLVLALGGCSTGDGGQVASAGSAGQDGGSENDSADLSREERAAMYAECMRENGVDMPDPEPGKGIQLKLGPGTDRETVDEAMEACHEYSPQGTGGGNPKMLEAAQRFAECMRENGVEDFPDPDPDQPGIRINPGEQDDPDFPNAQATCQDVLADARSGGQG